MHTATVPPPRSARPTPSSRQLALPLTSCLGPRTLDELGPCLAPRAVWRGLPSAAQIQLRLTVLRIVREVVHDPGRR
jgi:hypothetical protein